MTKPAILEAPAPALIARMRSKSLRAV